MCSPKARRITPLVTIPSGMARLFFGFWGSVAAAVSAAIFFALAGDTPAATKVGAIDLNRRGGSGLPRRSLGEGG